MVRKMFSWYHNNCSAVDSDGVLADTHVESGRCPAAMPWMSSKESLSCTRKPHCNTSQNDDHTVITLGTIPTIPATSVGAGGAALAFRTAHATGAIVVGVGWMSAPRGTGPGYFVTYTHGTKKSLRLYIISAFVAKRDPCTKYPTSSIRHLDLVVHFPQRQHRRRTCHL